MISRTTWQEIINAVESPRAYLKGRARRTFRTAVELAVEQVCNALLGADVRSPEQMTLGLNRWIAQNAQHENIRLAQAVVAVLADYKTLQTGGSPDEGKYLKAIGGSVMTMINLIKV